MNRNRFVPSVCALALGVLALQGIGSVNAQSLAVELEPVVSGLTRPVGIEHAGDRSGRLFVLEQAGRVQVVTNGRLLERPFLDITDRVELTFNEQGLLGLAFHPDFELNGEFFVHYIDTDDNSVVARCSVNPLNPNVGDPDSCVTVLEQAQTGTTHNGGKIAFGPTGYLNISLGDGGGGGGHDAFENALDTSNLLGAILRIDVDGDDFPGDASRNYAIPPGNPFVGEPGADEIWAFGFRNPWRFSFDRVTGDLWIGDVGQNQREEINFEPASSSGGENYGWDVLEGSTCHEDDPGGDGSCADFLDGGSVLPALEYSHSDGCSVIGGFRYRGLAQPRLYGAYLFADFCFGTIWGTIQNCSGEFQKQILAETELRISAFGESEAGELFLAEFSGSASAGKLHRVVVDDGSVGADLSSEPGVLDYGSGHSVGSMASLVTRITHSNTASNVVVVDAFGVSDRAHFQVDVGAGENPCGATPFCLAPAESCTVGVTFTPRREGDFDERLNFLANVPPNPVVLEAGIACTRPNDRVVTDTLVTEAEFFTACVDIAAAVGFQVAGGGRAELRAGGSVALRPGVTVSRGGTLGLVVDPSLVQP